MKTITYRPLETVIRTPPLGLRCVDFVTRSPVTLGLRVTATPVLRAAKTVAASPTQSGLHVLQGLPGLHEFEYGVEGTVHTSPPLTSPPAGQEFAIRVEDAEGRYLPFGFVLTLPRRDIVTTYLFPAPAQASVSGLIAIRGGLKDQSHPPASDGTLYPAGFARIEAQYVSANPPTKYVALADARGQFALFLPSPNPLQTPPGETVSSPNTVGRKTLAELRWPIALTFFYEPLRQKFICARADGRVELIEGQREGITNQTQPGSGLRCVPDLPSLLVQSAAQVFSETSGPAAARMQATVEFGKDMVVRTQGGDSNVWITP